MAIERASDEVGDTANGPSDADARRAEGDLKELLTPRRLAPTTLRIRVATFLGVLIMIVLGFLVMTSVSKLVRDQSSINEVRKLDLVSLRRFDSTLWKNSENSELHERLWMVDDLLQSRRLIGMTRAQVDALLSKAPSTEYFSDYDYVYWLGPERGFMSIDSEWLGIKFKDDIVIDARLLRD